MSVTKVEKEKHLKLLYQNNVVVAMDRDNYVVVHSKRTVKPLLPFQISEEALKQWKQRDKRIAMTETPYNELFSTSVLSRSELCFVENFNDIEFSEY
ncbi:hypothetical protein [Paenibacillus sp. y28]|uniref:hypothetical protein n=1 Tax=Paenibacillus sp. y28 TaxID=3129110 RepID=UPI003017181B